MKERWLVRLLVDRDPDTETIPRDWDWVALLQGGDPIVLHTGIVGIVAEAVDSE